MTSGKVNAFRKVKTPIERGTMLIVLLIVLGTAMDETVSMQYDDGSGVWMTTGYAGVWFHSEDFIPAASDFQLESVELWFLHSSAYPWDTSQFKMEVWNSSGIGDPEVLLFQTLAAAQSYIPVEIELSQQSISPGEDFFLAVNTEFSSGGWPSLFMDATPPVIPHSSGWAGWITEGDLLVRCEVEIETESISPLSWAGLKTLFRE